MVTEKQMAALRYLIAKSPHGNDLGKQIFWFLIDQSAMLTKEVYVSLIEGKNSFSSKDIAEAARSLRGIWSANGSTHIGAVMDAIGTDFNFSHHYGHFTKAGRFDASGQFAGVPQSMVRDKKLVRLNQPMRYTFWLARDYYEPAAQRITVRREQLTSIDLSKPGLYESVERQRTG